MEKVELIESLKEKYKIESVETALNFIQEVIAEVAFSKMMESPCSEVAVRKLNNCAETLDGIKNTMKAWGTK